MLIYKTPTQSRSSSAVSPFLSTFTLSASPDHHLSSFRHPAEARRTAQPVQYLRPGIPSRGSDLCHSVSTLQHSWLLFDLMRLQTVHFRFRVAYGSIDAFVDNRRGSSLVCYDDFKRQCRIFLCGESQRSPTLVLVGSAVRTITSCGQAV